MFINTSNVIFFPSLTSSEKRILNQAAVAHACYSSYLGGKIRKIVVEVSPGKKLVRPHLNQKLDMVVHIHHPSYSGKCKIERSPSRWA
jgi:hypothetical protein